MPNKSATFDVLFVDDEADNLNAFVFNCEEFWNPHTVMDPDVIIRGQYSIEQHDAIIVDLLFSRPDEPPPQNVTAEKCRGLSFLEWLQENHPEKPVMVLSAYLDENLKALIHSKYPKVLCMQKPLDFSREDFRDLIEKFIRDYRNGEPSRTKDAQA